MADMPLAKGQTGVLLAAAALIWAGMVIGVSGLATPVKFSAPSLTLPVALDVGRVTFHLFTRIEWGLAVALVLLGAAARLRLWWLRSGSSRSWSRRRRYGSCRRSMRASPP